MTDLQTAIHPTTDVEALILDWAGTVVDFGSFAPTSIFVEAFARAYDFPVTLDEARQPMGLGKWDHIAALGRLPSVDARWQARFGHPMSHAEVDHLYHTFMPLQIAAVTRFAAPIPGVLAVLGYSTQEVQMALKGVDVENLPLEEIIRQSLKKMVK